MRDHEIAEMVRLNLAFFHANRTAEKKFGISIVQYHLLSIVRDYPGISLQSLSQKVGAHPSTLTQSIRRLEKKKALFVGQHPKDSRKKIISLTRIGLNFLKNFSLDVKK